MKTSTGLTFSVICVLLAGCGDDDATSCDPNDPSACSTGSACELVTGGEPACFPETAISGKVSDATNNAAIAGARVVALDGDTGAAASTVATTDVMGNYRVVVRVPRFADAARAADQRAKFTLRVAAEKYQDFPSPIRQAIPIESTAAIDAMPVATRDVTLLPIVGADPAMLGSITGTTKEGTTAVAGVLVVVEGGGVARSAVSDTAGNFVVFNVPAGTYDVKGYIGGKAFTPVAGVVLTAGQDKGGVALLADAAIGLSRVTGGINIVNGQTTTMETLVVLALASTGEVPPGLAKMTMATAFDIGGIPPGTYDILASFNNDDLVIDPDPSQLPRPIRVDLPREATAGTLAVGTFKITGDVGVVGPGTGVIGEVPVPATGLMLRWMDDSSEDFYGIEMFDAYGMRIWGSAPSFTVEPTVKSPKNSASIAYAGPALVPGQIYQWRVTSYQCKVTAVPCTELDAIASSENLRGVFQVAAP